MAQAGFTPIQLYFSSTASSAPIAGNLTNGELAINITDGKLFYKDNLGAIQVIGTKGGVGSSSNTQVLYNASGLVAGSANLTFDGTILSAGAVKSIVAATQDSVTIQGRAGGTGSFGVTLTPTTLTGSRTLTLPDVSGTILQTGTTVTVAQGGTGRAVGNYSVFANELHVSKNGNDSTGDGTLINPVLTITQALTLIGSGVNTVIVHPGTYTENPTVTGTNTTIATSELTGANTLISGTLTLSAAARVSGLKMTNLTITGAGSTYISNCTVDTQVVKSGSNYVEIINSELQCTAGVQITGAGTVSIVGNKCWAVAVSNASANVLIKDSYQVITPSVTAGTLNIDGSAIFAATPASNAVTSSAGSFITLANSFVLNSAGTSVERVSLAGFYSILNLVYNRTSSTFTGTSLNAIDYFQYINADNLLLANTGSVQFADADSSNYVAFKAPSVVGSNVTWTLPSADGGSGQFLSTNGTGTLSWASAAAAGVTTISFGTTGLTPASATAGAVTVAGTLATASGGTGLSGATPFTSGGVLYASSQSVLASSAVLTANAMVVGGGAGSAPLTRSNITSDNSFLQLGASTPLRFADSDSSNYVSFQAPATITSNVTWTLPATDGTSSQVLSTNGSGTLSWATVSATPGGSNTQIQFNNSSAFGGSANLTWDGTNVQIGATGALRFADTDSSNYVAFKSPGTVAANVTWTLPATDGTASQVLSTNGSGTLSWATATATASPLVESQTLITSSYSLAANKNAMSFGTTTIAPGVSVTIAPLDKWVITTYFGVF